MLVADRATLAALLDRVRGAEVPTADMFLELRERLLPRADYIFQEDYHVLLYAGGLTDAALALAERVLPGWGLRLDAPACTFDRKAVATLRAVDARGATPALALLAAILTALLAQAETEAAAHG